MMTWYHPFGTIEGKARAPYIVLPDSRIVALNPFAMDPQFLVWEKAEGIAGDHRSRYDKADKQEEAAIRWFLEWPKLQGGRLLSHQGKLLSQMRKGTWPYLFASTLSNEARAILHRRYECANRIREHRMTKGSKR